MNQIIRRRTHFWKTKVKSLSNDVLEFISQSEQHVLNYINNSRGTEFIGDEQSLKELHSKFYSNLTLELKEL
jgi:dsDNA-specific endonuclease/ATPase MutS2